MQRAWRVASELCSAGLASQSSAATYVF